MLKFISSPQDQRYLSNIDRNRNVDHWLWNQNVLSEFASKGMWVYNHVIMELRFFLRVMPWIYNCILSILDIDKSIMNTSNIKLKLATTDHRWPVKPALSLLLRRCGPWGRSRREAELLVLLVLVNNWALHHSGNNWFIEASRSLVSLVIIWLFVQTDRLSCHLTALKRKSKAKIISKHILV